jgi:ParB-like chromosome segregation protein Spo0J
MTKKRTDSNAGGNKRGIKAHPAPTTDPGAGELNDSLTQASALVETGEPSPGVHANDPASLIPAADADRVAHLRVADLGLHPLTAAVPKMGDEEWQPFSADVKARGVLEPIIVQEDGRVLDGRHRLEAARQAGHETIPARVVKLSKDEQVEWVFRFALLRRHLTDDQRAVLAALWAKAEVKATRTQRARKAGQAGGRGRPKTKDSSGEAPTPGLSAEATCNEPNGKRVRERAGELYRISEHKLRAAVRVGKSRELSMEVLARKMTLAQAARKLREEDAPQESHPATTTPNQTTPTLEEGRSAPLTEQTAPPAEEAKEQEPENLTSEAPQSAALEPVSVPQAHPPTPLRRASVTFPLTARGLVDALRAQLSDADAAALLQQAIELLTQPLQEIDDCITRSSC